MVFTYFLEILNLIHIYKSCLWVYVKHIVAPTGITPLNNNNLINKGFREIIPIIATIQEYLPQTITDIYDTIRQ